MLLRQQLLCVAGIHRTAVLHHKSICSSLAVQLSDNGTDVTVHLVSLIRRSGLAGADGPYRLISDDHILQLFLADALQSDLGLHADHLKGDTLLTLLQHLTNAKDHFQPIVQGSAHTLVHGLVGLAKILAALTVADDHIGHAHGLQHGSGHLSSESTFLCPMAVLSAHLNIGAFGGVQGSLQIHKGCTDDYIAIRVCHQGFHLLQQSSGLCGGVVHFPVAGNDGLTKCFVHNSLTSFIEKIDLAISPYPAMQRYRAAPCPPGIPKKRRRR